MSKKQLSELVEENERYLKRIEELTAMCDEVYALKKQGDKAVATVKKISEPVEARGDFLCSDEDVYVSLVYFLKEHEEQPPQDEADEVQRWRHEEYFEPYTTEPEDD